MLFDKINILSTRPLPVPLIEKAAQQGLQIDVLSFIETIAIKNKELQQKIEQVALHQNTVVFTSMNAVEVVADTIDFTPNDWSIYCIGTTTNELVNKYFGKHSIAGTANSAAELAVKISENKAINKVTFFCGDQRRDELPEILHANNIEVTENMVYKTIEVNHRISKIYDAILFYSPSAVKSFFKQNILPQKTLLFAIGSTTAKEIQLYSTNKIMISKVAGKENLVNEMMEYFSSI